MPKFSTGGGAIMKSLAVFVFPGFQTLDLFGPLEMLGGLKDRIRITIIAKSADPVPSVHGQRLGVDRTIDDGHEYDLLLIPGGDTALDAAKDLQVLDWLAKISARAELVMTVCTGIILLGMSGVLDGRRAATNKIDFTATVPLAPNVDWVRQARWVEDGKFFTSSGVSAGIDMSLGAIAHLYGTAEAQEMADGCEYEWHENSNWDPFAEQVGLV